MALFITSTAVVNYTSAAQLSLRRRSRVAPRLVWRTSDPRNCHEGSTRGGGGCSNDRKRRLPEWRERAEGSTERDERDERAEIAECVEGSRARDEGGGQRMRRCE